DTMSIEISDTGIGIDERALPVIFNAFEQGDQAAARRFGGLGLGLAISKSLMDMHGGQLIARSPGIGLGSTFTISLSTIDPAGLAASNGAGAPATVKPAT